MSNEGFTAIPNCILDKMADLSPAEFKALMAMYRLIIGYKEYRESRRRPLSLKYLMKFAKLSKQGVIDATNRLIEMGYISKVETDGTNEWVVNSVDSPDPKDSQPSVPPVNQVDPPSQPSVPSLVNSVDQPSNKENINKEPKEKEEIKDPPTPQQPKRAKGRELLTADDFEIPTGLDCPEFRGLFDNWIAMRWELKSKPPVTLRAGKQQLDNLIPFGRVWAINRLKQAIANQWQGLVFKDDVPGTAHLRNGNGHRPAGKTFDDIINEVDLSDILGGGNGY